MHKNIIIIGGIILLVSALAYGWSAVDVADTHAKVSKDVIDGYQAILASSYPDLLRFRSQLEIGTGTDGLVQNVGQSKLESEGGWPTR